MPGSPSAARHPVVDQDPTMTDTPPVTTVDRPTTYGTAEDWIPLVDEPPPLDWDLEDLFAEAPR